MMKFKMESDRDHNVRDVRELWKLLDKLNPETNTFAILEKFDEAYLQVGAVEDGYIVEKRDGNHRAHYYASHLGFQRPNIAEHKWWQVWRSDVGQDRFSLDEVKQIFADYLESRPNASGIEWVRMPMQKAPASGELILTLVSYGIGALFIGLVALALIWEWL